MSIPCTVENLEHLGVGLEVHGDRLLVDAPKGVLNRGLLNEIKRNKAELIEILNLRKQWSTEVEAMMQGDDPDWCSWSLDCRASWADFMHAIAVETRLINIIPIRHVQWLQVLKCKLAC